MLTNPYSHALNSSADNSTDHKLQVDVDGNDKALLMSIRPVKGTTQLIVSNLIHNLCNDLRTLQILGYRLDGDEILAVLTSPRPITQQQCELLGRTSAGVPKEISTRLHVCGGGKQLRASVAVDETKQGDDKGSIDTGKRRSKGKTGADTTNQASDQPKSDNK